MYNLHLHLFYVLMKIQVFLSYKENQSVDLKIILLKLPLHLLTYDFQFDLPNLSLVYVLHVKSYLLIYTLILLLYVGEFVLMLVLLIFQYEILFFFQSLLNSVLLFLQQLYRLFLHDSHDLYDQYDVHKDLLLEVIHN